MAHALQLSASVRLTDTLSGAIASLPSLAADLNKEAPAVHIDDAGIALHHEVAGTLRNVFTHLLRNSVDHGIEETEARLREGKPAAGRIVIDMALHPDTLQLRMADDGRGLNLERIRAKAVEAGLISRTTSTKTRRWRSSSSRRAFPPRPPLPRCRAAAWAWTRSRPSWRPTAAMWHCACATPHRPAPTAPSTS